MDRTDKASRKLRIAVIAVLRSMSTDLFDPYRPELHYMRGPGPRWREKHEIATAPARLALHTLAAA